MSADSGIRLKANRLGQDTEAGLELVNQENGSGQHGVAFANLFLFVTSAYFSVIRECYGITGCFCLDSGLEIFRPDSKHLVCWNISFHLLIALPF